jgi:hypothetical protein
MSADPEWSGLIDVGAEVDRTMGELVAAGFDDEDEPLQPGEIKVHRGDGRLR